MFEVVSGSEDHARDIITDEPGMDRHGDTEGVANPTDHEELTIKIAAGVGKTDNSPMSILETTVEPEMTPPSRPSEIDAASTHSLPVHHVTQAEATQIRPSTARLDSSGSTRLTPLTAPRSQRYSSVESTVIAGERTNRHRSTIEVRKERLFSLKCWWLMGPIC